jgi:iron(III) transport system substrate-binding protein
MQASSAEKDRKVAAMLGVIFPNQGDRGAHVNVSGAGVVRYARNKANAIRFIEYLSSPAAQKEFAQANHEYPVHPSVQPSALVASWGTFRADGINLTQLGEKNREAVEIFDQAGWR